MGYDKPSRHWRYRFSIRTLLVAVTLVCCYFGGWEATKRYAVGPLQNSTVPFVVYDVFVVHDLKSGSFVYRQRVYYLWTFGPKIRLFETTFKERPVKPPTATLMITPRIKVTDEPEEKLGVILEAEVDPCAA